MDGDGRRTPPSEGDAAHAKGELRRALRAHRRALVAGRDLDTDARSLADHVLGLAEATASARRAHDHDHDHDHDHERMVVLSYVSLPHEPPTGRLNERLLAAGHRVLVPITLPWLDLDWRDLTDTDSLPRGTDSPASADLVIAPGLAVDVAGTRLGQGGGSYDRVFPRLRPGTPVVVLLHPGELRGEDEAPLPREPHDVPVGRVISADGSVTVGSGTADEGGSGHD
ncbi:5-formyltetrahydrofolate cyclo-ligase [Janibacter alkaliphilus]|uniref:5-formyltetrahydrofolate cyclo-ligase n=1 Tax=Janibacter alkaliphilus TaxID=1069963 RepID=A0A852XEU8_9MICO|nr:5-formyltetrahydrofolate cyclo-ligase [Janibacter alkaliphilus]NYG37045.1 5-formyltetrahydrofolate cyclo-ligase [Janibacter alkaliphilus]